MTSESEIISSTSEKPRWRRRELWRPADIIIITQAFFAEVRHQGTREGGALLGPGDSESHGDLPKLRRRRGDDGVKAAIEGEPLGEVRGEPFARERRGETHGLGLRRVGLEVVEI